MSSRSRGPANPHRRWRGRDIGDLSGAYLSDARLSGANLTNVKNLTQGQLDTACGNADTKLPEGTKLPGLRSTALCDLGELGRVP